MSSSPLLAFYEYLSVIKSLGTQTIESYMLDISQLQDFCRKDASRVNTDEIIAFLSLFENKRTLNRKLSSINQFFNFCHTHHIIEGKKPTITMAKLPQNLPKFLSFEQISQSLEAIDKKSKMGLRNYALILFLYATGARVSEALKVQRSDVEGGWVKIRFAKNQKERVVPIAPVALQALNEHLQHASLESQYIWLNYQNNPLSRISAYKIVKRYLGVSPHTLRHSFASSLIIGGANLKVVQELLGHASLVSTQIYTHIHAQELAQTITTHHPLAKERP